jgi:lipoate-protein ligase B
MRTVAVTDLGLTPYQVAEKMMRDLQMKRLNDEITDTLLILEHEEVVTVGPRARNDGVSAPEGYPSIAVDRGGGLTWHGSGQMVFYPIFKWDLPGEVNVAKIIQSIEEWVISALAKLKIDSSRDQRMQGVWVDGKKVCSIGLSFRSWVSRHGFTINLDTPSGRVEEMAGCGLEKSTTTSLARLGQQISPENMRLALLETMLDCIGREAQGVNEP